MKKLTNDQMIELQGGNVCALLGADPIHALLYCNSCSAGYTVDAILNGSFASDPTYYLGVGRFCTE